jgi:hypothetical protein
MDAMTNNEMVAELRAAAASLVTAAAAVDMGDLSAAEIGIEDALFRTQSLLARVRQTQVEAGAMPPPVPDGNIDT